MVEEIYQTMNVIKESLEFSAIELEDKLFKNIESKVLNYTQEILNDFDERLLKFKPDFQNNSVHNYEEQLYTLNNTNKNLRKEVDEKLKALSQQQSQYENFKQDHKLLTNQIKETHESFLMARKCYKKYLNFYYTIESRDNENQIIFLQFFTETKKDSEKYSVRLVRNTKTEKYSLQSMNPTLKIFKDAQTILNENNNVPGVLAYIRQGFASLRNRKK